MPLIRCTKKLLTEMGDAALSTPGQAAGDVLLGDWFANLLRIEGQKCVIFTSERTLLTFLVPGLRRDAIRDLPNIFRDGLSGLLESEAFTDEAVDRLHSEYRELAIASTNDRRVLGSLNDLSQMAEAHVQHGGGLHSCDVREINHRLNQTPMKLLKMLSPIAATKSLLGGDATRFERTKLTSRRTKKPRVAELDEIRITRDGDTAVITHADPDVAVTHFQLGPQIAEMSDEDILACLNASIELRNRMAAAYKYVAIEIPPGNPQIRYSNESNQWIPRGDVVRCIVDSDDDDQPVIYVDDQELSLEQFGRLLATYAGWGMRIEFTPDDETDRRPPLEIREPDRSPSG